MEGAGDLWCFLGFFHSDLLILPKTELKISEIILKDHKPSYPPNPSKKKEIHHRINFLGIGFTGMVAQSDVHPPGMWTVMGLATFFHGDWS